MAIKPLEMPNLSQLPDPMKDLMGGTGLTNPTSLMTFTDKEIQDLFAVKPLTDMTIKPSAEAAKALQQAQQTQDAINQQARQAQAALDRQTQAIAEQRQRAIDEQIKASEQIRKEREKALKEQKEKQGGKLGANPDGTFVLSSKVKEIIADQGWNSIVSDKERTDKAERYLSSFSDQLKKLGASDEVIKAEIDNARSIFKANIDSYAAEMKKDGRGGFDLTIAPLAKYGGFLMQAGGLAVKGYGEIAKAVGLDNLGGFISETGNSLLDRGREANEAAEDFASTSIKLNKANAAYEARKFEAENPNANWRDGGVVGVAHGATNAVKRMWNNDLALDTVADFLPQLAGTMGVGAIGKAAVGRHLASMELKAVAGAEISTATKLLAGTYQGRYGLTQLGKLASADRLAMGAYGTAMGVTDAGTGAYDQVMSTSFADIKKHYGEQAWNAAVKAHGSEEAARQAMADDAMFTATRGNLPIAVATSMFGIESAFSGLMARKAIVDGAKKFTISGLAKGTGTTALESASEALEEGYTQYSSNVGANPYTGVDLMSGVSEATGLGAFLGGTTAAVMNAMSGKGGVSPQDTQLLTQEFVTKGNFNEKAFNAAIERQMGYYQSAYDGADGSVSIEDLAKVKQAYYNAYIDNAYTIKRDDGSTETKSVFDLMTDEQAQQFKERMQLEYGINTNDYARYRETKEYNAFKNNDIDALNASGNQDLINAWRIKNNVELEQIPPERMAYTQVLAKTIDYMASQDENVNTKQREQQFAEYFQNTIRQTDGLTALDGASIFAFAQNILGANSRRMSDQEQAEWNAQQQVNQNGTNEQEQTTDGQSSGQTTLDDNAEPITSQSPANEQGESTGEINTTEELADALTTGATVNSDESVGNGTPRQEPNTSNPANTTATAGTDISGNSQGTGQAQNVGNTSIATTPTNVGGQTTSQGATGQASQSGQSVGQTNTVPTQTTTGNGGVGVTPSERNSNDGSPKTLAEIRSELNETGAEITPADMTTVLSAIKRNDRKGVEIVKFREYVGEQLGADFVNNAGNDSDIQIAIYLTGLSNNDINTVLQDLYGYKKLASKHPQQIRSTRKAILDEYAKIAFKRYQDEVLGPQRAEAEAQRQAEREQQAQTRAEEKAREQSYRDNQKAQREQERAEEKARREEEKEQQRREKEIATAENAITTAERVLEKAQDERAKLEQTIAEITEVKEQSEKFLDEALGVKGSRGKKGNTGRKGELTTQIKNTETLLQKANTAITRLETEKKSLKQRTAEYKTKAEEIKREKDGKAAIEKQLKDLKSQLKTLETAINSHKKTVDDTTKTLRRLNTELNKAIRAVDVAQTKLDKLRIDLDLLLGNEPTQTTTEPNSQQGSQDVNDTNVEDIEDAEWTEIRDENPQAVVEQEPTANLPAVTTQPQRDKRMRIEMTSTGLPTILMGMESTGMPTIEMGYTIYLDYVPEQHKAEVRQDLLDDIPSEADIVGIIRELADTVGVSYDIMLDKLASSSDTLNQNEYDGLASLLDTILVDLYGETNGQTNTSSNSQSTETSSEAQRSEQGTARETENGTQQTTLPAVLGFSSLEVASRELTPLVDTPVTTLAELSNLIDTIAQATNLPTDVIVDNLTNSRLLLEEPQGNILDFIYDEINDVWVWASEFNPPQQGALNATQQTEIGYNETASGKQGNRTLNAPNRAGTKALAEPAERVQKPIQLGTTDTGLGTIELGNSPSSRNFELTLSASTLSIPGLKRLQDIIDNPNTTADEKAQAGVTLNNIAFNHLSDLVADIDGVTLTRNSATGLYGGAVEPSLLVNVEVTAEAEQQLRSALVKFADNFNQEQVHLRQETDGELGAVYPDGSFNTVSYQIELNQQIDRAIIDKIIADSGLFGLTVYTNETGNSVLEFYYYGKPTDTDAIIKFEQSAEIVEQSAERYGGKTKQTLHRAWFYAASDISTSWGAGFTIPYTDVTSELRTTPKNRPNAVVSAVAQSLNPTARGFDQKNITKKQFAKQATIAKDYDKAPLYDLDNPIVRRAYEELAAEVKEQYLAMPLKGVELLTGQGEPYANSTEMREDVRVNNKIKVFATTPDSFGSNPNIDYTKHPLMQDSGLTDINGQPMLMNDLFRAVHDYYAHSISPVAFGPKGEEAAWKNHLSMMKSPWAAWALTTETRGQNSWVNFREEVQDVAIKDRPFADQKTALLPLKHAYTGQADIDAKLDLLAEELIKEYGKSSLQGSLAPKKKLVSKKKSNQSQLDLFEQEQTNATNDLADSQQLGTERTTNDNSQDTVGVNQPTNVQTTEVSSESGRENVSEQETVEPASTQDTDQLGTTGLVEPYLEKVSSKQIETAYGRAGLTIDEKSSIGTGRASIPNIKEMLTNPQADLTATQQSALNKLANYIKLGKASTKTAPSDSTIKQNASKQSVDVIAGILDSNPDLVEKAETALDKMGVDVSVEEFVRDVLSADFTSREVEAVLNNPSKYKKQFDGAKKSSDTDDDVDYAKAKKDYDTIRSGGPMGNQRGAVTVDFFFALPIALFNAVRAVWNGIKNNFAKVSLAIAITAGSTFTLPTEAQAATPTETAVVENIVKQNDNQGKQFIVADKQAGTLTIYTPTGQQITSTPALFGKTVGDTTAVNNATPSGRYDMEYINGSNIKGKGYGNSAQALTVNGKLQENNAGNIAIHRVLPIENRQAKLDSTTVTDNRISHGCINVPVPFYDSFLDSKQDTVVYVMPETGTAKTGVFDVQTEQQPTQAETTKAVDSSTPVANVAPAMDKANGQSVTVTPEQIQNATPHDQVTTAPVIAQAPLIIKGAENSTQTAVVTPTVIGGITADKIVIPTDVHTPAEHRADGTFDTQPISSEVKTEDGLKLADVVLGIMGTLGTGLLVRGRLKKRAKKLASKKAAQQQSETVDDVQETIDENHNNAVNKQANNADTIPTDLKAPPQKTAIADAISREMWIEYLTNTNQLGLSGNTEMASGLHGALSAFEWQILDVMTDLSYQQANDGTFDGHRDWGDGEVDTDRTGIFNKFANIAAGATPIFDNLMGKLGIARIGHEADSSIPSRALAQVKSKAQGAYAQIHKLFVGPIVEKTELLAQQLRRGGDEIQVATGRVATLNHILNEAADAHFRGMQKAIDEYQAMLDNIINDLNNTPAGKPYPLRDLNTKSELERTIAELTGTLNKTRDMYYGKLAWDGETPLPGGYTKAKAEKELADIKSEFGLDFHLIENNAKDLVKAIRGIRQFATAAGVFTNEDLKVFKELGFTEYVPLYSPQKDPTDISEEDNYTRMSTMDRLMRGIPLQQARSMGLTKDLSRYHRKGSKEPAQDAFTNMKVFAMNMSGRIGQQNWLETVQQMYEGTVGKPFSSARLTDPQMLADLNEHYDSGKVPGLIRVRTGMRDFLPSDIKQKIDNGTLKPITAKGYNANGDLVSYEYFFTEPAIQAEIYANMDLAETIKHKFAKDLGAATRIVARAVTVGKPVWNAYNMVRDSFERLSVMLMRPVKDRNGNIVGKWALATAFFRALPQVVLHSKEIYRYLTLGETVHPIQQLLNEAVGEGAINLMTTQTEKHSVIADLKKGHLEKAMNKVSKWTGTTANKLGMGGAKNAINKSVDFYIIALTEIPQVTTALASYKALQDVGVNKAETANRVRDQYDPNRTNSELVSGISTVHPFVRSTLSGHYNLARSLTQYWKPGEWQFTLGYTVGGTILSFVMLALMAGAFEDDEDGRSEIARLPLSTLTGGIPVPVGENGVWTMPVGFGLNKLVWGLGANLYRLYHGYQTAGETALGVAGLVVDNTSPILAASGTTLSEDPTGALVLSAFPVLAKPLLEMALNKKSFGGGKIYGRETPSDQLDSNQDNFNTPEFYKDWAKWWNENGFGDHRPETFRHLFESYANLLGPLKAIPTAVVSDTSEKTLGNKQRKGEMFGPVLTALGADMSIQPNALDVANLTYEMGNQALALHRKYGVGRTHKEEDYEKYAERGSRGGIIKNATLVTERKLRDNGVPENVIEYLTATMKYQKEREDLNTEFQKAALEYHRLRKTGKDDLEKHQQVQALWDEMDQLTQNYVRDNNAMFYTLPK